MGLHPKKACVHHLDSNTKDYIDVGEGDLASAVAEMDEAIKKIVSGDLKSKPSEDCELCDWRKICSKKPK